jgi:hypothetical protein
MSKVFSAHAVSVDGYISGGRTPDGDEEFGRGLGDAPHALRLVHRRRHAEPVLGRVFGPLARRVHRHGVLAHGGPPQGVIGPARPVPPSALHRDQRAGPAEHGHSDDKEMT